mmetsp:Transcript_13990/g.43822  ORF Transcript_13990/g.43822 Transcript_13990/m.43822 type:complete len:111 (+) Transcript_13990:103-435(+)
MTASGSAALPLTRPRSEALLRGDDGALDAGAARLIRALGESDACLIWHKCGTFHDHLVGVWRILAAWQQEQVRGQARGRARGPAERSGSTSTSVGLKGGSAALGRLRARN